MFIPTYEDTNLLLYDDDYDIAFYRASDGTISIEGQFGQFGTRCIRKLDETRWPTDLLDGAIRESIHDVLGSEALDLAHREMDKLADDAWWNVAYNDCNVAYAVGLAIDARDRVKV